MRYFYRAHCTSEAVLDFAAQFFDGRGLGHAGGGADFVRYTDQRGAVDVRVEIEGGHYACVTVSTRDVGESELDRVAKRFLAELHALEEPGHAVRGAY